MARRMHGSFASSFVNRGRRGLEIEVAPADLVRLARRRGDGADVTAGLAGPY
jgi:hypothetical protein